MQLGSFLFLKPTSTLFLCSRPFAGSEELGRAVFAFAHPQAHPAPPGPLPAAMGHPGPCSPARQLSGSRQTVSHPNVLPQGVPEELKFPRFGSGEASVVYFSSYAKHNFRHSGADPWFSGLCITSLPWEFPFLHQIHVFWFRDYIFYILM